MYHCWLPRNAKNVFSGVPQGSVLRPFQFLIYVNFITGGLVPNAFVDDYKIYLRHSGNNFPVSMLT